MAALDQAIKAGDPSRVTTAYEQLTAACNTCHRSADRGVIVIQSPPSSVVSGSGLPAGEAMIRHLLLAVLASVLAIAQTGSGECAQAPDTVFLEELTWTELRDLVGSGKTTIIVPIGGTEQNGPHMALGKHNRRVQVLSEKIARALGNALVAPVDCLRSRRPGQSADRTYAVSRHDHRAGRGFREDPRIRGAQLQARRFPRYRLSRRSRVGPEGREGGRRSARSGVGGD